MRNGRDSGQTVPLRAFDERVTAMPGCSAGEDGRDADLGQLFVLGLREAADAYRAEDVAIFHDRQPASEADITAIAEVGDIITGLGMADGASEFRR